MAIVAYFDGSIDEYQVRFAAWVIQVRPEQCPHCDQVCQQMAMIWASGPLLAPKEDMAEIADAIEKVYENRDQLKLG